VIQGILNGILEQTREPFATERLELHLEPKITLLLTQNQHFHFRKFDISQLRK